jgi:hypothetical protein
MQPNECLSPETSGVSRVAFESDVLFMVRITWSSVVDTYMSQTQPQERPKDVQPLLDVGRVLHLLRDDMSGQLLRSIDKLKAWTVNDLKRRRNEDLYPVTLRLSFERQPGRG